MLEIRFVKILYPIHQEATYSHGILNHLSKSDLHNFQIQYENKITPTHIKILPVKPNPIPTQLPHQDQSKLAGSVTSSLLTK